MAIANYTELQSELIDWFHRADLNAKVPVFIQLGEAYLNRKLRTMDMETRSTASISTTSRYLALPTRFVEMVSLSMLDGDNWEELTFVDSSVLRENVASETIQAKPTLYTIKDELEFDSVSDQAYTLEMHYYKQYDIAADTTNWLLTNYPDLYMYASFTAAEMYLKNDNRVGGIKSLMAEAVRDLNISESRKRGNAMATSRVDNGLVSLGSYNIYTG